MPSSIKSTRSRAVTPTPSTQPHNGFSLISNEKLLALYSAMLRCRLIEQRSRELIKTNPPSGFYASTLGREASTVGVAIDLHRTDRIACIAPAHPTVSNRAALGSIRPTVPVIEEIEPALRFALLQSQKKSTALVVAFSMKPFTSSDEWQHALQRASDQKLPILFVAPAAKTTRKKPQPSYAFPTIVVDGNDVVAVYRVASEAIFHARKGHGATLIECVHASGSDPLRTMEKYLRAKSLYTPALKRNLTAALGVELYPVS